MKIQSHQKQNLLWAVLTASFLCLPRPLCAAESPAHPHYSHEPADKEACEANLNLIFEAIQEYRKQKGRLPDGLYDLTPDFVRDPKTLICPYIRKTGGLRSWIKEIRELDFDPRTSYGYEFTQKEFQDDLWRGLPKRTWREYKQLQMKKLGKLGPMVPIVRCHFHRPWLNLAFDGQIYESADLYWERKFSESVPEEDLEPARLFADPAGQKRVLVTDIPARDPRAGSRTLDLSANYNGLLGDSWQGFPGDDLAELPSGLQKFGGVPFDARGVVQLSGAEGESSFEFPKKVEGIRVNQICRRIHFLHGSAFDPRGKTNIACYVIHYADNQVREFPIVYGQQIADWWFDSKRSFAPSDAKVVWTGQNEAAKAYGKALRLYQTTWENPLKDIEVASISLVSRMTLSAPFVIAITVDP